ncbi:MAG TPA: NAD-binding protein [Actinomycetes bacterium]|jgi:voltage-gated potassium channel|nr:NAD-binding protein [Actinomycetes bacterium]HJY24425.1 NAD-binding protein [Actinomycetes bacterium]
MSRPFDNAFQRATDDAVSDVVLPSRDVGPFRLLGRRVSIALGILVSVALIVYIDRDGYRDAVGQPLSLLDAFYYATVSLSTTGYGDITPASPAARLVNILFVTPARVLFLIILVGTTLEVLTQRTQYLVRLNRWRAHLRDHTIVIGYGTKGRAAVRTMIDNGVSPGNIVVIDPNGVIVDEATRTGVAGVAGDATRSEVLRTAHIQTARQVIVAADRDDSAVLITLSARALNPRANIVASVRESENGPLLEQSGADTVITSSEAAGRLLGLATSSPFVIEVVEDLLTPGSGLELVERPAVSSEIGKSPKQLQDKVLAVVRDGELHLPDDAVCVQLVHGDRLVVALSHPHDDDE